MKRIYIIGIGMGNPRTVTLEGKMLIEGCGALVGASRMVNSFIAPGQKSADSIAPGEILDWIEGETEVESIGVLMSGDVGFFSGAKKLGDLIEQKYGSRHGNSSFQVSYIPGISSLSYFGAKLGLSWEGAKIVSLHGRDGDPCGTVASNYKTFFLTDGGDNTAKAICRRLEKGGLGDTVVHVGERLSYDDETISSGSARDLSEKSFDPLSVMLVTNKSWAQEEKITLGIPDEDFTRGTVPMTKEEVRTITVSKLNLQREDVIYDIGAGTGSVSIEIAKACPYGRVYAIETNEEGLDLMEKNKNRFNIKNLKIVAGLAPEAMQDLPKPHKAFIGGSKGNLGAIIECLIAKNSTVRIVINVVALETLAEAVDCVKKYGLCDVEIVQVNISKAKALGSYNLMMGQNPVYIISGTAPGK